MDNHNNSSPENNNQTNQNPTDQQSGNVNKAFNTEVTRESVSKGNNHYYPPEYNQGNGGRAYSAPYQPYGSPNTPPQGNFPPYQPQYQQNGYVNQPYYQSGNINQAQGYYNSPMPPTVYYGGNTNQPTQYVPPHQVNSNYHQGYYVNQVAQPYYNNFDPEIQKKLTKQKRYALPKREVNAMAAICLAQSGLSLVWQIIIIIIYLIAGGGIFGVLSTDSINWMSAALIPLSTLLPSIFYVVHKKQDLNSMIHFENKGALQAMLAVFAGSAICLLANYPAKFVSDFMEDIGLYVDTTQSTEFTSTTWVYIFAIVILAPFMEEFVFRGVIFSKLEKYGTGFAILASGLLFGMAHTIIPSVVFATIVGIALGFVYAKTRNLMLTVAIHLINNLYASFTTYGYHFLGEKMVDEISTIISLLIIIIGIISLVVLAIIKRAAFFKLDDRICPKKTTENKNYGQYVIVENSGSLGFKESLGTLARSAGFWVIVGFILIYLIFMQVAV